MFSHEIAVLLRGKLGVLLAVGRDDANLAVVEVDLVVRVHHAHVIGAMGVGVRRDKLHVSFILQDDVLEYLQRELRKIQTVLGQLLELRQVRR